MSLSENEDDYLSEEELRKTLRKIATLIHCEASDIEVPIKVKDLRAYIKLFQKCVDACPGGQDIRVCGGCEQHFIVHPAAEAFCGDPICAQLIGAKGKGGKTGSKKTRSKKQKAKKAPKKRQQKKSGKGKKGKKDKKAKKDKKVKKDKKDKKDKPTPSSSEGGEGSGGGDTFIVQEAPAQTGVFSVVSGNNSGRRVGRVPLTR